MRLLSLQEEVWVQKKMTPERSGCAVLLRNEWNSGRPSGFDEAGSQLREGQSFAAGFHVQQLLVSASIGSLLHGKYGYEVAK